jgi:hypothetical protein
LAQIPFIEMLYREGIISSEEFKSQRAKILDEL